MTAGAYYNEIDPYAADWLRNLIAAGHIAPGDVDERSIEDVHPDDIRSYTQCHFFAGIGVWSYALRRAGWPDDRPVWTGSCPCQPFSSAGKGAAFDDERHLWPAWHWLISQRRPPVIFGEQVASKDAVPWLDLVQTDLEALGYDSGAVPFPSAGIGAPHIRDRTYFVAHAAGQGFQGRQLGRQRLDAQQPAIERGRSAGRLANAHIFVGGQGRAIDGGRDPGSNAGARTGSGSDGVPVLVADSQQRGCGCEAQGADHDQPKADGSTDWAGARGGSPGELGNSTCERRGEARGAGAGHPEWPTDAGAASGAGPVNGFWRAADWLLCRDGKWRPVEPGTFPLAHGAPARVGRLRAYGNAINAQQAQIFIEEAMNNMQCIQPAATALALRGAEGA